MISATPTLLKTLTSNPMNYNMKSIKPSHWINTGYYLFGIIGFSFIIPPLIAAYKFIELYCINYTFDKNSIIYRRGVFLVDHTEVHFYRIKSVRVEEPLLFRLVGISNVYIKSSDPYQGELKLWGVPSGINIWKGIKEKNFAERKAQGVREFDMFNL